MIYEIYFEVCFPCGRITAGIGWRKPDWTVAGWTKALSSSVFDVAFKMNFKVVLTLHDYFTACPNGGYFDYKENKICKRKPLSWKCIKCNCDSNSSIKISDLMVVFI